MEIEGVGSFAHRLVEAPPIYGRMPDGSGVVVVDWAIDLPDRVAVRRYGLDGRLITESTLDSALREIHQGRVWLRLDSVGADDDAADEWVVVGPDGTPEFRITAPPGVTLKAARGDRVWGTGKTEMDIPYIVLYEMGPSSG